VRNAANTIRVFMSVLVLLGSSTAFAAKAKPAAAAASNKPRYGRERLRADWVPPERQAPAEAATATVSAGNSAAQFVAARNAASATAYSSPTGGTSDAELGRGFAGNIRRNLENLQEREGILRRGVAVPTVRTAPIKAPAPPSLYDQLSALEGVELIDALQLAGREIMFAHPVGTPVEELRESYRDLIRFISERTGVPQVHIYRVMDLESSGGQYWVSNASGACGLVQVRPIALEELQRLAPEEFAGVSFKQIAVNPAMNLYAGMRYAQLKNQDWDHYSGGANGYAHYVRTGERL
jgi:hypothetical protein